MHPADPLPSAREAARLLGGNVRHDGSVAFPGPGRKPKDRSCTLRLDAKAPDGFVVADAQGVIDGLELKDHVRERIGVPFQPRRQNSGHGSVHRASRAAPSSTSKPNARASRNGEGEANSSPEAQTVGKASRLFLLPFDAIKLGTARRDLIKGVVPRWGLTVIWGPPKCGKSFLAFDMATHIALGWDYRGHRVQPGPVVYCYLEGQNAAGARKEAWRQRHLAESAEPVPFFLMPVTMKLVADCEQLIALIKTDLGVAPVAIILDTLNRSFSGSESSDEDMTAYVQAADAVREAFECAVIVVHHCGHDKDRPRGHTALIGAADASIAVCKDPVSNIITAKLDFMKDGPADAVMSYRFEVVEVGTDDDGEAITSCVLEPVEASPELKKDKARGLRPSAKIALEALKKALTEGGSVPPACNYIPPNTRTVTVGLWRRYAYQGDPDSTPTARQKAFQRSRRDLQATGLVGIWGTENGTEDDAQCWLTS